MSSELEKYIETSLNSGIDKKTIEKNLTNAGWEKTDIEKALKKFSKNSNIPVPPLKNTKKHSYTWEIFEHILLFITLYISAISLGLILHFLVDRWIPGVIKNYSNYLNSVKASSIRWAVAYLIVSFPVFAYLFIDIGKKTSINSEIRSLHERKFFSYLTLIVTFFLVFGNLIHIIYNFLEGNVTLNFALHFFVTVFLASSIFFYYLKEVKQDREIKNL